MNKTIHLRYARIYETDKKEFKNLEAPENFFLELYNLMDSDELDSGIYSYYSIDKKIVHHTNYNPELFWDAAMELILYQTYGVIPVDLERKNSTRGKSSARKNKENACLCLLLKFKE